MTPTLGKRKRRDRLLESATVENKLQNEEAEIEIQALLRQHFEDRFEPLDARPSTIHASDNRDEIASVQSDSDWDGLSEEESESPRTIIHKSELSTSKVAVSRDELKTFMSAKPPSLTSISSIPAKPKPPSLGEHEEADTDSANLKKDLALQRLLKESHLLDPQSSLSHSSLNRHKALDLRLQDMGSKYSIFKQENMPFSQRRGILIRSTEKETTRRQSALENGIILEKAINGKKHGKTKRQRGIGGPNVGKFQGGMLKLSKKDVFEIEGPQKRSKARR